MQTLRVLFPVAMLAIVVVCCWRIERATNEIRGVARDMILETHDLRAKVAKMLSSSWTDTGGITRTVNSTQKSGESWAEFLSRHDSEVEQAKVKWPVQ